MIPSNWLLSMQPGPEKFSYVPRHVVGDRHGCSYWNGLSGVIDNVELREVVLTGCVSQKFFSQRLDMTGVLLCWVGADCLYTIADSNGRSENQDEACEVHLIAYSRSTGWSRRALSGRRDTLKYQVSSISASIIQL